MDSLVEGEIGEIDYVRWRGDHVNKLPHLRLVCRVMKKLQYINIIALVSKVRSQKVVQSGFENHCIVKRDVACIVDTVPAWVATSCDALVHKVIRYEEEGLKLGGISARTNGESSELRGVQVQCTSLGWLP